MKKIFLLVTSILLPASIYAQSRAEINAIKQRLEELEFSSYEKYTNVGGSVENRFMSYVQEDKKATDTDSKFKRLNRFMIAANIDVGAEPTDDLSVYMRISMKKFWNRLSSTPVTSSGDGTRNGANTFGDLRVQPGSSLLYLSRAFVKYRFLPTWVFSIGRLPTLGGPPKEYLTGSAEGGAYHTLAISSTIDGAAVAKSHKFSDGSVLGARVVYSPFGYYNADQINVENVTEDTDINNNTVKPNDMSYSAIVDYATMSMPFAKNSKFMYQYFKWDEIFVGTPSTSSLRATVDKHIFAFDFKGLFSTSLDFNFAYAHIATESKGTLGATGGVLCVSSNTESCKVAGDVTTFVTKYNFTPRFSLGYQFINQSAGAFSFDVEQAGYAFFQTPGSTGHKAFAYYKHNDFLTTQIAYTRAEIKSSAAVVNVIGARSNVDKNIEGYDIRFIARF